MAVLFDLIYRTARLLGAVTEGIATGGSTTTIVDTNDRTEAANFWNGGTAFLIRDAGGAGAAPEKQSSVISSFTGNTLTLRTALTVAAAVNDKYGVTRERYTRPLLIQKVNEALQKLGTVPVVDTTTLDTAANQTEYTLPIAAKFDLRQVFVQGKTGDANDNQWIPYYHWHLGTAGANATGLIFTDHQLFAGRDIRIVYMADHAELHADGDNLSEYIHMDRVVYEAAAGCLLYRKQLDGRDDPTLNEQINYMADRAQRAAQMYLVHAPPKQHRLPSIGGLWTRDQLPLPPQP